MKRRLGPVPLACGTGCACLLAWLLSRSPLAAGAVAVLGGCLIIPAARAAAGKRRALRALASAALLADGMSVRRLPRRIPGRPVDGEPLTDWEVSQLIGIRIMSHLAGTGPHAGQQAETGEP